MEGFVAFATGDLNETYLSTVKNTPRTHARVLGTHENKRR